MKNLCCSLVNTSNKIIHEYFIDIPSLSDPFQQKMKKKQQKYELYIHREIMIVGLLS